MTSAQPAHRRHDIPDSTWKLLEPHLPGRKGTWGGNARDNRQFINAIFWILRASAPWRDLPPDYGGWKNTHRRFCRWRDRRVWEKLLGVLIDNPDLEWLMIDASHIKVHPHAAGARGGNQDIGCTKGGFNTKAHLAVDAHGMPLKVVVTAGTVADCTQAGELVRGINADYLIADKGYDSDEIVDLARDKGMQVVIPLRKNRKQPREYDRYIYRLRHLVENAFLHLKQWRGIATRYAKNTASFLAVVHVRCIAIWAKIYFEQAKDDGFAPCATPALAAHAAWAEVRFIGFEFCAEGRAGCTPCAHAFADAQVNRVERAHRDSGECRALACREVEGEAAHDLAEFRLADF